MNYKSIFDYKLKGKTVFLRADLNSSVVEGRVVISSRLREHSKNNICIKRRKRKNLLWWVIKEDQTKKDLFPFKDTLIFIKKFIDKPVKFIKWEDDFETEIKNMKEGEIILLDNTRFQKNEQQKKTPEEHGEDELPKKIRYP